ncbi:DUF4367 domain-containing protein [Ruminococcus sp.]|uniref:DUF4367 domain-containing protein n=1 Tax=Ruminococcus sp. TaxID=41978 RepID=UPI0025E7235D|nr:DUF4367 domain-containing protein [Ruminococcus sp.]MCR4638513.1 DUF4367 domain-containing protein [Ruminococcus sp.]
MKEKATTDKLSDKNMLDDLQALLNEELAKPIEERDLDAIEKITVAMVDINDVEIPQPVSAEKVITEVSARRKRHRIALLRKWAAALSACFVLCLGLNLYTLKTYGSNVFEAMINMARSGFSIDTNQLRDIEPAVPNMTAAATSTTTVPAATQVTEVMTTTGVYSSATGIITQAAATTTVSAVVSATTQIPAGSSSMEQLLSRCSAETRGMAGEILTKSESAGIYPCYPTFLPSGFEDMSCTDFHNERLKDSNDCYFTFENSASKIDITAEEYYSEELMPDVLVPSDNDSYEIFRGKEISGFIMGDSRNCTAVFVYGNTVYTLHGSGVNRNELKVIAESFVPYPSEFMKK